MQIHDIIRQSGAALFNSGAPALGPPCTCHTPYLWRTDM